MEENKLDIPVSFDEATLLFHKADTFHKGIHPEDDELRQLILDPKADAPKEGDLPPTLPFTVSCTPPDGIQAQKGSPTETLLDHPVHQGPCPLEGIPVQGISCSGIALQGPHDDRGFKTPLVPVPSAPSAMEAPPPNSGPAEPENTLPTQQVAVGPQGQGTSAVPEDGTRELLLKMKTGPVKITIHSSCPIAVIKMIWAGESYNRLRVNYVRVSLASQMAIRALPPTAYVWLDWSNGPQPGPDPWWKPVWRVIKDTLERPWCMPCPEEVIVQSEEQLTPYVRSKVAFTAMLGIGGGRLHPRPPSGPPREAWRAVPCRSHLVFRNMWLLEALGPAPGGYEDEEGGRSDDVAHISCGQPHPPDHSPQG